MWRLQLAHWLLRGTGFEVMETTERAFVEATVIELSERVLEQERGLLALSGRRTPQRREILH